MSKRAPSNGAARSGPTSLIPINSSKIIARVSKYPSQRKCSMVSLRNSSKRRFNMIKLHSVKKIYEPQIVVLDGVDLEIKQGEFVSLVGVSGAGKSTVLKMLTREEHP